jgi:hypothetical protein
MNNALKWTLISLPVLIGGYVIYVQVRKYKIPAQVPVPPVSPGITTSNGNSATVVPPYNTVVSSTACNFPLKKGSYNNTCVGSLQDALGVTIDNDFGSQTEGALYAKTGKKQIDSASDLSAVINQLNAIKLNSRVQILSRSGAKLAMYQNNQATVKYIEMLYDDTLKKVEHDVDNEEWNRLPFMINLTKGQKMKITDYQPVLEPDNKTGYIVLNCTAVGNRGYWMISPDSIAFVG